MGRIRQIAALAGIATLLLATGCGTIGETLLGAFKAAGQDAIQTATSQAVEKAVTDIEGALLQQAVQSQADETN